MGCGSSTDDALLARLRAELEDSKNKSNEQQNLLRFKIEVLVNMLAMEEKKSETIEKRVETLKGLLQAEGITEQMLTSVLMGAEKTEQDTRASVSGSLEKSTPLRNVGWIDLEGPLSRAQEEFDLYRSDIIPAFAGEDGKVVAVLKNDEFMKQLYQVTEKLTKADIQVIALRFSDGAGFVSIPEFLEFFTTPPQMRIAKAATAAVRMSLDLLQLTADEDYLLAQGDEQDFDAEEGETNEEDAELNAKGLVIPQVLSSHLTNNLDRGVRKLLAMWAFVKKDLENAFAMAQGEEEEDDDKESQQSGDAPTTGSRAGGASGSISLRTGHFTGEGSVSASAAYLQQVVPVEKFKAALLEKCGIKSGVLGHAEMEGKLTFNRTGKPLRTPGRPLPTPTPQHNRNGPASDVNNTHPGLNRAFSIAESKKTSDSLPKIEDKKGISSGAKQEDSRPTMKKGAALSMSLNGIDNSVKNSRDSLPPAPVIDPLGDVDVDMLTERFELDGCVHYGHFVQYFNELHAAVQMSRRKHVTLPPQSAASAASPFLVSSEWQKLRSSAVLQHYATAPPPPPTPALTQQQQPQTEPPTPKTSKPTPAVAEPKPATPAPADSKSMAKKGIDAADFQPGQLPPPKGVEVVEPSSGMFCCGGGSRAKAKNAPEPLLMPDRAEDKAAWVDPDEGGEEQEDAGEGKSQDDSSSGSEDRMPKVDRGFNTPVDRSKASKTKLSFQPRRVVREEESPEEDIQRSGLGKKDRHDVEVEEQQRGGAQRRNHFHRRDADTAGAAASTKANVSTSSSAARRRALESDSQSGSEEGFGAPRGVNSRWK